MNESSDKLYRQLIHAGLDQDGLSEEVRERVRAAVARETEDAQPRKDRSGGSVGRQNDLHRRPAYVRAVRRLVPLAAAAAVVIVLLNFWPARSGNGVVWADVARQLQSARTAHVRMVTREPSLNHGRPVVQQMYLRAPDRMRCEGTDPQTQHDRVLIVNRQQMVILDLTDKRFTPVPPTANLVPSLQEYLALLGDPLGGSSEKRLVAQGAQVRDGRKLDKYRLEEVADAATDLPAPQGLAQNFLWLEPDTHEVVLMTSERTIDGVLTETVTAEVRLNIELPDELFSTAKPAGFSESDEGALVSALRELSAQYNQTRERITRYRLIAWEPRTVKSGLRPVARSARDGQRWRGDEVTSPESKTGAEFEATWERLAIAPYGVSMFADHERQAWILWKAGKIGRLGPGDHSAVRGYQLAELGWPRWPQDLSGVVMDDTSTYRRLPERSDRPGLIGIQYVREPSSDGPANLTTFWIDPARDYLCVHYEEHWRKTAPWRDNLDQWQPAEPETTQQPEGSSTEHDSSRTIVEFGQTPDGHWYPKVIERSGALLVDGQRYCHGPTVMRIQADFTSPIPASLFEWPADLVESLATSQPAP